MTRDDEVDCDSLNVGGRMHPSLEWRDGGRTRGPVRVRFGWVGLCAGILIFLHDEHSIWVSPFPTPHPSPATQAARCARWEGQMHLGTRSQKTPGTADGRPARQSDWLRRILSVSLSHALDGVFVHLPHGRTAAPLPQLCDVRSRKRPHGPAAACQKKAGSPLSLIVKLGTVLK
ncbi:hypothetical protein LX32DRAFT_357928 [Colletotrichum zoysiae]|uniref:Uncharacterized protein n=1 Tax=Colletotrichum zoysiae TaxID=1216348 RepID=A0AAD9HHT9_9PEZI|nr:hypothetical protein LX32DRAFT_357928 [Colletotrichum zoysiae]